MTRLPVISGFEMVKILARFGWIPVRQTRSQCIMKKEGSTFRIVIPQHRELRPGIIHQIMKESDLSIEKLSEYLYFFPPIINESIHF